MGVGRRPRDLDARVCGARSGAGSVAHREWNPRAASDCQRGVMGAHDVLAAGSDRGRGEMAAPELRPAPLGDSLSPWDVLGDELALAGSRDISDFGRAWAWVALAAWGATTIGVVGHGVRSRDDRAASCGGFLRDCGTAGRRSGLPMSSPAGRTSWRGTSRIAGAGGVREPDPSVRRRCAPPPVADRRSRPSADCSCLRARWRISLHTSACW